MKCLTVAIMGATNAGKSTLVNDILEKKVSIVTHKVQTTRNNINAIYTKEDVQIIFTDTPGVFIPRNDMGRDMVKRAWRALNASDITIVIVDSAKGITSNVRSILRKLHNTSVLVLNKIDLIDKKELLKLASEMCATCQFERVFMISALKSDGVQDIVSYLRATAVPSEVTYVQENVESVKVGFFLAEITREKVMLRIHKEIPYGMTVVTESIKDEEGRDTIYQAIYVVNENHKKIVIGRNGGAIKQIRESSRVEMMKILDKKITLFLFVKVRKNWYQDPFISYDCTYN